jgi:hypothetical protein
MLLTKRSAMAFKFGERAGNRTDSKPAASRIIPKVSLNDGAQLN